jgi:hypothetical protein
VKFVLLLALVACGLAAASTAEAGRWVPGTPYMVAEEDMQDLLEKSWDSAYCQGVPRFGKQGEFPYEEYVVFDCSVESRGRTQLSCYDVRYKAIKASRRGWFKARRLYDGDCY